MLWMHQKLIWIKNFESALQIGMNLWNPNLLIRKRHHVRRRHKGIHIRLLQSRVVVCELLKPEHYKR